MRVHAMLRFSMKRIFGIGTCLSTALPLVSLMLAVTCGVVWASELEVNAQRRAAIVSAERHDYFQPPATAFAASSEFLQIPLRREVLVAFAEDAQPAETKTAEQ